MDMNSLRTKEPNNLKDEFDEIDDIYSYKEFSMEVRDTKPSFMDIDKNHLMNKIETEDFTPEDPCPENHILGQSIYLSCENQWNTTKENSIITPKSQNNDSKCILPYPCMCGPLINSTVDEVQKINQTASSSPHIDFDPNFNHRFWNTKDIDVLDLSVILKDDMARAIYNRGLNDGTEVASKNEVNARDVSRKHSLTLIKNHILNRRKIRSELILKENHFKKKLFEINNAPKLSIVKANDTLQPQFSIFDNIDASYLPLPAMQLMLNTALSNENNELCKVYDDQVIKDDKRKQRKKNRLSKCFIKNARTHQISKKNIHTNKCAYAMDHKMPTSDVKTNNIYSVNKKNVQTWANVNNIKLTPIIPLSVVYYMDELKSTEHINSIDINES